MIEMIVNWAISVLGRLGYLGIASLMALESACIPIPSEAILPFGGYCVKARSKKWQTNPRNSKKITHQLIGSP